MIYGLTDMSRSWNLQIKLAAYALSPSSKYMLEVVLVPDIDAITSKAYGKLTFIKRNISYCPMQKNILTYQSLIRP